MLFSSKSELLLYCNLLPILSNHAAPPIRVSLLRIHLLTVELLSRSHIMNSMNRVMFGSIFPGRNRISTL